MQNSDRLPPAVWLLTIGVFCVGTSEFMIAGILPYISQSLSIGIPEAGTLITAFAIGMMIGAPLTALATLRLPRKATLLSALGVFVVAHFVPLISDSYGVQLTGRVIAAVACATYWTAAALIVVQIAGQERSARALGALVGGLTLANILGVPGGTWIGEKFGWKASFVAIAVVTAAVGILLALRIPRSQEPPATTRMGELVRRELATFREPRLWLALATTALFQAAVFCGFSYLAPLLTDVAGLESSSVPGVLLLFGIGAAIGVTIGGRYADRNLLANVFISLTAMIAVLLLFGAVSGSATGAVVGVFLFGLSAFSIAAALNARVFAFAGGAPTLAASVNVSAFNLGNAAGPWIGGLVISVGYGLRAPIWVAVLLAVAALAVATASWRLERRPVTVGVVEPACPATCA